MATNSNILSRGALAALVLAVSAAAALATGVEPAEGTTSAPAACAGDRMLASASSVRVVRTTLSTRRRTWSYGWPVKPFGRQHPVRAFLDDPRIGGKGGKAFHFGIDVAVPDGTAVYAVEAGKVFFDSARAIAVQSRDLSHEFGYWHIVPVVKSHQLVAKHQLLGYVDKGWGHVHFAEHRGDRYLNPLRDGGLGPYVDRTAPTVDEIAVVGSDLVVEAHDTPDPRVPGAWAGEPVTPALLRWRASGAADVGWRTAADFRSTMLPASTFARVYTAATLQNHKGESGRFCFYLARGWAGANRAAGAYTVQVEASDTAGNTTVAAAEVSIGQQ